MKAAVLHSLDGPRSLKIGDVPVPERGPGQVLIRVLAAGVSFPELLQTRGQYQASFPLPFIPGSEVAGVIESAPPGSELSTGDRVVSVMPSGGLAEYAVADAATTFGIGDGLSYEHAAAMPSNYLTAHFALIRRGCLKKGERILVHGASGGLGSACIQVAKAFGAGEIIAVTSTAEKGEVASRLGADRIVLSRDFAEIARGLRVDLVADPVGGDAFIDSMRSLTPFGRLLVLGFASGSIPEVRVNRLLLSNISLVGVGYGAHAFSRPEYLAEEWHELVPYIESGVLAPIVEHVFPLSEAVDAFELIESRRAIGKVIVTM